MAGERVVVIGAGIVGLAVARQFALQQPDASVTVVEKEPSIAQHQSGHNSGVVHAGLYYRPGSLKARLCRRGVDLLREYCAEHGIPYRERGKLVVALDDRERTRLQALQEYAVRNGVPGLRMLDATGLREIEPHAGGVAALHSPRTAVVDYRSVCAALAADVTALGGQVRCRFQVTGIERQGTRVLVRAPDDAVEADQVIICAGLHADRVARFAGDDPDPHIVLHIVPFRGEYYRLVPHRADLVRGLIYPVPDPRYPFLGVHLIRRIDDTVEVGPNAVLALAREGYRRSTVRAADVREIVASPGFRALARRHWRTGLREMAGSWSRRAFVARARRYVPELSAQDLIPAAAGVRAQALAPDGSLVDDFRISTLGPVIAVRNAPSPAATSSLAIAEHIGQRVVPTAGPAQ